MLLGQIVSIAVASNLFYLALTLSKASRNQTRAKEHPHETAPPTLWISVILSLITVGLSPFTSERTFLSNLLVMHALLYIPLIPTPFRNTRLSIQTSNLYVLVLATCLLLRVRTIVAAVMSLPEEMQSPMGLWLSAWGVLHSHPAQSSIGWDVIWTTLSFIAWVPLSADPEDSWGARLVDVPYLLLATPLVSIGFTAPYILRPTDNEEHDEIKKE